MTIEVTIALVVFLTTSSAVLLVFTLAGGRRARLDARLDELAGRLPSYSDQSPITQFAMSTLPMMGIALVPSDGEESTPS